MAASVTAVAAVIALLPEGPRRYRWGAGAVAFSFLMGVSRTYLGAHWLSDAVAGVMLGTTIALGTAMITHRVRAQGTGRNGRPVLRPTWSRSTGPREWHAAAAAVAECHTSW